MNAQNDFLQLASRVADICFGGRIPPDHAGFIDGIVSVIVPPDYPAAVAEAMRRNLAEAVEVLACAANAKWKN